MVGKIGLWTVDQYCCSGLRNSRIRPLGKYDRPWRWSRARRHPWLERAEPGRPGKYPSGRCSSCLDRTPGEVCRQGILKSPFASIECLPYTSDPGGTRHGSRWHRVVRCFLRSLWAAGMQVNSIKNLVPQAKSHLRFDYLAAHFYTATPQELMVILQDFSERWRKLEI